MESDKQSGGIRDGDVLGYAEVHSLLGRSVDDRLCLGCADDMALGGAGA